MEFKSTKTEEITVLGLPASALAALVAHKQQQDVFREQFGSNYRADLDLVCKSGRNAVAARFDIGRSLPSVQTPEDR